MLETALNICVVTDPRLYFGQENPFESMARIPSKVRQQNETKLTSQKPKNSCRPVYKILIVPRGYEITSKDSCRSGLFIFDDCAQRKARGHYIAAKN